VWITRRYYPDFFRHEAPERLRRNRKPEYLAQRRKGRKGKPILNLAFLASWRE
jgi:hypothetical protein